MPETLFVMDSELCPECGELLGYFGECPNGCEIVEMEDEDEWGTDEDWDYY